MPKVKLSSQNAGGAVASSKLSPVTMNNKIASGGLRAASVNPSAGKIKFTPYTPNTVQQDMLGAAIEGGANTLQVYNQAAFAYNERNEIFQAKEAIIAYEQSLRDGLNGGVDASGNAFNGYKSLEKNGAVQGLKGYTAGLEQKQREALMALPEGVRKKAVLSFSDATARTKEQAAQHSVAENTRYQEDVTYQGSQNIIAKLYDEGGAMYDGRVQHFLAERYAGDPQGYDANAKAILEQGIWNKFNTITQNGGSEQEAVASAREIYDAGIGTVAESDQEKFRYDMNRMEASAAKAAFKAQESVRADQRVNIKNNAPNDMAVNLADGDAGTIATKIGFIKSTYPNDAEKGSDFAVDILTKSIYNYTNSAAPEVSSKMVYAQEKVDSMLTEAYKTGALEEFEVMKVEAYMNTLESTLLTEQKKRDNVSKYEAMVAMERGEMGPTQPPPGYIDKEGWNDFQNDYLTELAKGPTLEKQAVSMVSSTSFRANMILSGGLKDEGTDAVWQAARDKKITWEQAKSVVADNMKAAKSGSLKHTQTPKFKQGPNMLKAFKATNGFMTTPKPDKDEEGYVEWTTQNDFAHDQAVVDYNEAFAAAEGVFNPTAWVRDYLKENYKYGKEVDVNFLSGVWQGFKGVVGAVEKDVKFAITGEQSIFPDFYNKPEEAFESAEEFESLTSGFSPTLLEEQNRNDPHEQNTGREAYEFDHTMLFKPKI